MESPGRVIRIAIALVMLLAAAPARGGERFTDNGDGTVTDHETGLMWSATDNQGDVTWQQAKRWAAFTFPYTLPEPGEGWRLPTLEELRTLAPEDAAYPGYETTCGQKVRIVPLIRLSCGWVWTSDVRSVTATVFNFAKGYHYTERMAHARAYRALAVRSLK